MRPTHALAALVALASPVLGATASITSAIPNKAHPCLKQCAWYDFYQGNIPLALGCDDPYENDCYCPTATESVSKVSVAIEKCVSSRCGAGDVPQDLSSLRSIYAGYCKDAGYTQDAAMLGYTAATTAEATPSTTASSSSSSTAVAGGTTESSQPSKTSSDASTTTQKTTVTQTKASGADGKGSPVVVVQETETVFVDGAHGGNRSGPSMAIKIGVGVAVPVVVLLAMAGVGFLVFRKRRLTASRRRALADSAIVEEHGGGGQEQREMEKDRGVVKSHEPLTQAESVPKQGPIVYGLQEVHGSNRSDSYEVRGNHTPGAQEVHGSHRPGPYVAHESYRSDSHEVPGDHAVRIHEAHGNLARPELAGQSFDANAAAELPGSNGHARWVGGDRAA